MSQGEAIESKPQGLQQEVRERIRNVVDTKGEMQAKLLSGQQLALVATPPEDSLPLLGKGKEKAQSRATSKNNSSDLQQMLDDSAIVLEKEYDA
jgi:hypothetical protein